MMPVNVKKDLFALVADLDMEQVMKALCQRHRDLGTRQFGVRIVRHRERDSGCRTRPLAYLREPLRSFDQIPSRSRPRLTGRLFFDIAWSANLDRCQDPAFQELVATLRRWFPPEDARGTPP